MVDTEARAAAAKLIEQFRDGRLTNFQLEGAWPTYSRFDRAIRAVETMIWRFYSDGEEHTLIENNHQLTRQERDIFDRCILFLRSELEYQWPQDNFIGIGGLGILGRVLTLGLSAFIDRAIQRREQSRMNAMRIVGEEAFWPFRTLEEYTEHRYPDHPSRT